MDVLTRTAMNKAQERGLKVYVKTNLSPRLKVFDATDATGGESFLKVGIEVKDKSGNDIMTYGTMPETNYILLGSIAAIISAAAFFMIRGVVK